MPDIVTNNLVAEIEKKKAAIAGVLSAVMVTATAVASVLVAAVTTQKVGVAGVLRDAIDTTSTTAALAALANPINTTDKFAGKQVFNTTTNVLVVATGATAASTWVAAGAVAHTPI